MYFGNGVFRTVWGFLYDKFGFKKLIILNCCLNLLVGSTFYFSVKIKALFIIEAVIVSALLAAPFTLIPSGVQFFFGPKYATEIYGVTFFAFGFSSFIAPILSKVLQLGKNEDTTPFLIIYLVGVFFGGLALIIILTMSMKPYKFQYK